MTIGQAGLNVAWALELRRYATNLHLGRASIAHFFGGPLLPANQESLVGPATVIGKPARRWLSLAAEQLVFSVVGYPAHVLRHGLTIRQSL